MIRLFFLIVTIYSFSQNISLNEDFLIDKIRLLQISGEIDNPISFNIRPVDIGKSGINYQDYKINSIYPKLNFKSNSKLLLKLLPINNTLEYNSHHPYNRNNGSMIPNYSNVGIRIF